MIWINFRLSDWWFLWRLYILDQHKVHSVTLQSWWRHQMETFSALLAICAGNSPVTSEFPAQRPVTRILMFSLICTWMNNGEAGDSRRHRVHYDVAVMSLDVLNRPISYIPQCNKYATMHHFETQMYTHVPISVAKWCIVGIWDWCILGCVRSIA